MLTLKEFKEARAVLSGVILNTSLVYSKAFSRATGNQVYIKPENMQVTGAYKIRGAYYKISTLSEEEKARGLVTASAGNHAQGVAYAAQAAGVEATIVMPTTTPLVKVNNTKDYGAKVVLHGETFDDAAELADRLSIADTELMPYHGYGEDKWRQIGKEYALSGLPNMEKETADICRRQLAGLRAGCHEKGREV